MTRDDIIRMAREAGIPIEIDWAGRPSTLVVKDGGTYLRGVDDLERFAHLVAAAERQRNLELVQIIVEAEREACAKVVEQAGIDGYGTLAAAAMIRARGEK